MLIRGLRDHFPRGRVEVRPELMPRNSGRGFDGHNALGGNTVASPQLDRPVRDAERLRELGSHAVLADEFLEGHAMNARSSCILAQDHLSPGATTAGTMVDMGEKQPLDTFGARLRVARRRRRVSQTQVAMYVGDRSHQSVVNWEKGANFPELEKLVMVAELLETTIDWLVWGDEMASGIESRLRKIPKVLRDGLVRRLHDEITQTEVSAERLPDEMKKDATVADRDVRLREWSAKNKIRESKKRKAGTQ